MLVVAEAVGTNLFFTGGSRARRRAPAAASHAAARRALALRAPAPARRPRRGDPRRRRGRRAPRGARGLAHRAPPPRAAGPGARARRSSATALRLSGRTEERIGDRRRARRDVPGACDADAVPLGLLVVGDLGQARLPEPGAHRWAEVGADEPAARPDHDAVGSQQERDGGHRAPDVLVGHDAEDPAETSRPTGSASAKHAGRAASATPTSTRPTPRAAAADRASPASVSSRSTRSTTRASRGRAASSGSRSCPDARAEAGHARRGPRASSATPTRRRTTTSRRDWLESGSSSARASRPVGYQRAGESAAGRSSLAGRCSPASRTAG